ncbi:MAG TPA: ABC transporter ATP-binding protein [Nitrososphaerales archaeon]|nr:ABC transporter ATP-binding protein [Nitrososphaerales archaeon]
MQREAGKAAVAVSIDGLTKDYGNVRAVDGLDLAIPEAEVFGLLGPNGSGKTTTINCLTGLLKPTKGNIRVMGFDVQQQGPEAREVMGVSPQETAVYPYLTGEENVRLFGELYSVSKKSLDARVDYVLEKVGLLDEAKRRVGKYSGGMKRRVSIAMALVTDPKVILLDEPTVGMDPQARRAVWDFILELRDQGKTVVLTTHYMEEADELCDEVGIIDHGKLIELGDPAKLREKYQARDLEDVFIRLTGRRIRESA